MSDGSFQYTSLNANGQAKWIERLQTLQFLTHIHFPKVNPLDSCLSWQQNIYKYRHSWVWGIFVNIYIACHRVFQQHSCFQLITLCLQSQLYSFISWGNMYNHKHDMTVLPGLLVCISPRAILTFQIHCAFKKCFRDYWISELSYNIFTKIASTLITGMQWS